MIRAKSKIVVAGIDPGKAGGIAIIQQDAIKTMPMPIVGKEIDLEALALFLKEHQPNIIFIEKAQAMPKQGVTSMFTYGCGFGSLRGLCAGIGIGHQLVTPQAWKKVVLAGTKKDKDAAINYVKSKYPKANLLATVRCKKPHDGMADAICIAEYGLRIWRR